MKVHSIKEYEYMFQHWQTPGDKALQLTVWVVFSGSSLDILIIAATNSSDELQGLASALRFVCYLHFLLFFFLYTIWIEKLWLPLSGRWSKITHLSRSRSSHNWGKSGWSLPSSFTRQQLFEVYKGKKTEGFIFRRLVFYRHQRQ